MDEDQVNKLGEKMKAVYADVVDDAGTEVAGGAKRTSRQVQRARNSARRTGSGTLEAQVTSFVRKRPVVALLAAVGVGYVLSRLVSNN